MSLLLREHAFANTRGRTHVLEYTFMNTLNHLGYLDYVLGPDFVTGCEILLDEAGARPLAVVPENSEAVGDTRLARGSGLTNVNLHGRPPWQSPAVSELAHCVGHSNTAIEARWRGTDLADSPTGDMIQPRENLR